MPDTEKFKSVSVSKDTHNRLIKFAATRFEVPVSIQKAINFMLEKESKKNGKRKPS
tara:strand:+ start:144 stop:311 length:168 start_codon:yes stop_codon:yes gene_type:complete